MKTNKKNKRELLLLSAIILTIGVFAGCTKAENPEKATGVGFSSGKTATTSQPIPATTSAPSAITQTQAEDIALAHAGIARADVAYIRTEKDFERNYTEYDVEFRVGDYEYSYEVNVDTGVIISNEKEYEGANAPKTTQVNTPAQTTPTPAQTQPTPTQPEPAQTTPSTSTQLTQTQAEDIALAHAGIARSDVAYIHTEKDFERNYTEYDVEFRVGDYEYSYEINADTGVIISHEKEYENDFD
jgi:uncharacterized membrane protein YkoI